MSLDPVGKLRSVGQARISGYLGKNAQFDEAMGQFALAYADQAERDHAALKAAVSAGIVEVRLEQ